MVLADIVDRLRCPNCDDSRPDVPLVLKAKALRCPAGHTFDVARQGYASLLTGHPAPVPGDTAAMVAAREAFLAGGHFALITSALAAAVGARAEGGCAVDLGAGTGHHLAGVLEARPGLMGIAADISGYALRRAARAHPRAGAIRCDAWRPLPFRSSSADVVLNVFAPRNGGEIRRVLDPDGVLVVVVPTERHLRELATAVGEIRVDPRKADRLDAALGPYLTPVSSQRHETTLALTQEEAVTAVAMGPAAWHADADQLRERLAVLPEPITATVSVTVATFRPVH